MLFVAKMVNAVHELVGSLDATKGRYAIVASRFNSLYVDALVSGARDCLRQHGATSNNIFIVRVSGSFEIPLACQRLAKTKKYDALIAVGALIEGETDHYDHIANQVSAGLSRVSLEQDIPIGFGIITAKTMEQAQARSGSKAGNLGYSAAAAAIEQLSVLRAIPQLIEVGD